MRKLLLCGVALACLASANQAQAQTPGADVCVWGNNVTLLSRAPSGRPGYDSVTVAHTAATPFAIASGHPDEKAILSGQPFSFLFPEGGALPEHCTATDVAINALYLADDTVQAAIATDVCSDESRYDFLTEHNEARDALPDALRSAYDAIRDALGIAYRGTNQTDGELDAVDSEFCDAVAER